MSSLTQVNVGTNPGNNGDGDPLRDAFIKTNQNNLIVNGVQGFSPLPLYQCVNQSLGFGYNYYTLHTLDSNANINFSSVFVTFIDEAAESVKIQVSLWLIQSLQTGIQSLDVPKGIDTADVFKNIAIFERDLAAKPATNGVVALGSQNGQAPIAIEKGSNLVVVVGTEGCNIGGGYTPVPSLSKQSPFSLLAPDDDLQTIIKNGMVNEGGAPAVEFFYRETLPE